MPDPIVFELRGKPSLINALSAGSHWQISKERKAWREIAHAYCKYTRVPAVAGPVVIHVRHLCTGRLPDVGAVFHASKGAVDGIVDAGVLADDSPKYVVELSFCAPIKADHDGLLIEIEPVP